MTVLFRQLLRAGRVGERPFSRRDIRAHRQVYTVSVWTAIVTLAAKSINVSQFKRVILNCV